MNNFSLTCNRCGCTEINECHDFNSFTQKTTLTYKCTECGLSEVVEED